MLQLSTVHVYLTYPFVLSWSLLEAMSAGCAIVASNTPPLQEVIRQGDTGLLIDFFSPSELTESVCELVQDAPRRAYLGGQARAFAKTHYDLASVCLPRQLDWVETLTAGS
jgi:glycosyltransferase involved in cell wall biosynthesis